MKETQQDFDKVMRLLKQVWYQWAAATAQEDDEQKYKMDRDYANFKRENGIDHL